MDTVKSAAPPSAAGSPPKTSAGSLTTKIRAHSAGMRVELIVDCSAEPATVAKLLTGICLLLQKADVSAANISGSASAEEPSADGGAFQEK